MDRTRDKYALYCGGESARLTNSKTGASSNFFLKKAPLKNYIRAFIISQAPRICLLQYSPTFARVCALYFHRIIIIIVSHE